MRSQTTATRRIVLAGTLALLLAACDREAKSPTASRKPAATATPAAGNVESTTAEATRNMVAGVTVGKSRARVNAYFDLPAKPEPGTAFKIAVAVVAGIAAPAMSIEVSGTDGLTILVPTAAERIEQVQSDTLHSLDITAQAARPGIQLVNVAVTLEEPAGLASQNFSFPILVGGFAIAPTPPAASKPVRDKKPAQKAKAG